MDEDHQEAPSLRGDPHGNRGGQQKRKASEEARRDGGSLEKQKVRGVQERIPEDHPVSEHPKGGGALSRGEGEIPDPGWTVGVVRVFHDPADLPEAGAWAKSTESVRRGQRKRGKKTALSPADLPLSGLSKRKPPGLLRVLRKEGSAAFPAGGAAGVTGAKDYRGLPPVPLHGLWGSSHASGGSVPLVRERGNLPEQTV